MSNEVARTSAAAGGGQPAPGGGATSAEPTRSQPLLTPRTDIFETRDAIVLLADMPGVPVDRLEVTLENRVLTIRGATQEARPEGFSQIHREYVDGTYERTFTLSEEIDQERIDAALENGMLRLTLPKVGPAQARRIAVRVAAEPGAKGRAPRGDGAPTERSAAGRKAAAASGAGAKRRTARRAAGRPTKR